MSLKRVGIVGSGIMGSGIAEVAAVPRAIEVVLRSRARGRPTPWWPAGQVAGQAGGQGQATRRRPDEITARVTATTHLGAGRRDLVIESVVEDLAVKKAPLRRARQRLQGADDPGHQHLHPAGGRDGHGHGRPDKVCGIHFFNPAPAMALVEVVRPITADDETIAAALGFAEPAARIPSR
jgi:3-hydroxybutyryl-CoA dehydrogenase